MNELLVDFESLSSEVEICTKYNQFSTENEKFDKLNSELDSNRLDIISR